MIDARESVLLLGFGQYGATPATQPLLTFGYGNVGMASPMWTLRDPVETAAWTGEAESATPAVVTPDTLAMHTERILLQGYVLTEAVPLDQWPFTQGYGEGPSADWLLRDPAEGSGWSLRDPVESSGWTLRDPPTGNIWTEQS